MNENYNDPRRGDQVERQTVEEEKEYLGFTETQWYNILAWLSFGISWIFDGFFSVPGVLLGYQYYKRTGKKASFVANLILLAIVILVFIVAFALMAIFSI